MDQKTVKLFYEEHGRGTGVVLVHGFPLNHTIWDAVVPLLQGSARVITPDLRGHGKSPVTAGSYAMDLLAADIAGLLDELKLKKVFLVGHSMGGYATLAFARIYPERLLGLALVASHPFADSPEARQGRILQAGQVLQDGTRVVADSMAARLTQRKALLEPLHQLMLRTDPLGVAGAQLGMAERPDTSEFLEKLDVPVLILAGEQDVIVPLDRLKAIAGRLKHGQLVMIPGAGHMPMLEEPERTASAILEFIQLL